MKQYSLSNRLISWIGIPIIAAIICALIASYIVTKHEIEEVYDAQLVHSAKVLLQLTEHEITEDEDFHLGLESEDLQHRYERNICFRIWHHNVLITQSNNSIHFNEFEAPPGFSDQHVNHQDWRFFVYLSAENGIKIEVSERYEIRYELIFELLTSLIIPALGLILCIFIIVYFGAKQVLKPVVDISDDVDSRNSDDLSPITANKLPQEIAPLIQALNRLLNRIEDSFKREREFTDHAAHELRTPLAAMKTQTQVLMKKYSNKKDNIAGFENLSASIDRATHLVEQLLSLARLQHEELPKERTNLSACLRALAAAAGSQKDQGNFDIQTDIASDIYVMGDRDSISIMLGNIIDNALKYASDKPVINITLSSDGLLNIIDNGPGLSDEDKSRVFNRFVRADKSGKTGSGLGLSIAQWIAEAHNIQIKLHDNKPSGLNVEILWRTL